MKFAVRVLRALTKANPTACMAIVAIVALFLAAIAVHELAIIALAILSERP